MYYKAVIALILAMAISPVQAKGMDRESFRTVPWHQPTAKPSLVAKKWDDLSPEEKEKVKEAKEKYKKLPREKKEKLRKKWEEMPKKEREKYKLDRRFQ